MHLDRQQSLILKELGGIAVGARIRALREASGLSQGALSLRTGIHRPIVSRLESGRWLPQLATLDRLAEALDVPIAAFLPRDRPERPTPAEWAPVPGHTPPRARRGAS